MKYKIAFVFIAAFMMCFGAKAVLADLTITPTRIVLNDKDRFAVVTLVNSGDKAQTYEMGWRYFKMQEEGDTYVPSDRSATEFDLSKHIMFTPRRVTLAPGAKQKVRLRLNRPAELAAGDYRAHFEFASVREEPKVDNISKPDGRKAATVSINVGYTIPIVLRVGTPDVKIDIGRVSFARNPVSGRLDVSVPLVRSAGPYGGMGHLYLIHVTPDGKEEVVGEVSNAHIFPEVNRRVVTVPLTKEIAGGKLRAVLYNYDKENRFILAQTEFPLN